MIWFEAPASIAVSGGKSHLVNSATSGGLDVGVVCDCTILESVDLEALSCIAVILEAPCNSSLRMYMYRCCTMFTGRESRPVTIA